MSRKDARPLLLLFLSFLLPCVCIAQGIETAQEWAYGDGLYQGRSLRLVQDGGTYVGGTLGEWRSGQVPTRIAGVFLGFKAGDEVQLDVSVGGYSELDTTRPHPLGEMVPKDLASMGKMAVGMKMSRRLRVSVGGLYLRATGASDVSIHRPSERFLGQAHIDYRFF